MTEGASFDSLSPEEKSVLTQNILVVELMLERLTQEATGHLGHTRNLCVKSCLGGSALELLHDLDHEGALMVLTLAVRRLAELRYEAGEGNG